MLRSREKKEFESARRPDDAGLAYNNKPFFYCLLLLLIANFLLSTLVYQFNNSYRLNFACTVTSSETFNFYPLVIRDDPSETPFKWSYHKSGISFKCIPPGQNYRLRLFLRARNNTEEGRYFRINIDKNVIFEGEATLDWTWHEFDIPSKYVDKDTLWITIFTKPRVIEKARGRIIRGIRVSKTELELVNLKGFIQTPKNYLIFSSFLLFLGAMIFRLGRFKNKIICTLIIILETFILLLMMTPLKDPFVRSGYRLVSSTLLALLVGLFSLAILKIMSHRGAIDIGRDDGRWVSFITSISLAVKAGPWFVPFTESFDLLFHIHRMNMVFNGDLLLMSHAGPYRFPYPPSFYIFLYPFRLFIKDDFMLIKVGFALLIGLTPLLIYLIALKILKDRKAALISILLFVSMPIDFYTYILGILANGFGLFMMLLSITLGIYLYKKINRLHIMILLMVVFSITLLSHFGQMISFTMLALFTILVLFLRELFGKRSSGVIKIRKTLLARLNPELFCGRSLRLLTIFMLAALIAFLVFYRPLLGPTLRNISKLLSSGEGTAGSHGLLWLSEINLFKFLQNIMANFALVPFIAAVIGYIILMRKYGFGDRKNLFITAWLAAFLVQLWLAMREILMLRFELFLFPLVAILAGHAISRIRRKWIIALIVAFCVALSFYFWIRFNARPKDLTNLIIPHKNFRWLLW